MLIYYSILLYVVKRIIFFKKILKLAEDPCRAPNGEDGLCISLDECDGLKSLLRTQADNPRVRFYLQRSTCGFIGNFPKVCCPSFRTPATERPIEVTSLATTRKTETPATRAPDTGKSGKYEFLRPPNCGNSSIHAGRIVGGVPAKIGKFIL